MAYKYIKEYLRLKKQYNDKILIFECENTYEAYDCDAFICNKIFGALLSCDIKNKMVVTSFPLYKNNRNVDIDKLLKKGYGVCTILKL